MTHSEPACRQAFSFFSEGQPALVVPRPQAAAGEDNSTGKIVIVQVKKGELYFILDSLTSIHLPWTQNPASRRLKY